MPIKIKDAESGGDDDAIQKFVPALFRMTGGLKCVWRKPNAKPPISKLKTSQVMMLDTGFQIFIWAGKASPIQDRTSAFTFAQSYLKKYKRPSVLPITRFNEAMEDRVFTDYFGPAEQRGGCACIVS